MSFLHPHFFNEINTLVLLTISTVPSGLHALFTVSVSFEFLIYPRYPLAFSSSRLVAIGIWHRHQFNVFWHYETTKLSYVKYQRYFSECMHTCLLCMHPCLLFRTSWLKYTIHHLYMVLQYIYTHVCERTRDALAVYSPWSCARYWAALTGQVKLSHLHRHAHMHPW